MIIKKPLILVVIVHLLVACQGDYTKKIGNTGLTYIDNGEFNRLIVRFDGRNETSVIETEVHAFFNEGDHVFGLRQVLKYFGCNAPPIIIMEVTNRLEFFVITVLDKSSDYTPTVFTEFKRHLEVQGVSVESANRLSPELHKKNLLPARVIGKCKHEARIIR